MDDFSGLEKGLTFDELAREVVDAMRAAGLEGPVEIDSEQGVLVHPERGQLDLEDAYRSLRRASGEKRAALLSKLVRFFVTPPPLPESWEAASDRLVPHVKPQVALVADDVARQRGCWLPLAPVAPITPHLSFEIVVPVDGGLLTVSIPALERWDVDGGTALLQAAQNLEKRSDGNWLVNKEAPGVYASPWRDGLDPSRLFLPRVLAGMPLRGPPVVLAPSAYRLLVAGSDDDQGLFDLARMGRRDLERGRSFVFLRPIRLGADGESWEDWLPPRESAAYHPLRFLQAVNECSDYDRCAYLIRRLAASQRSPMPRFPPLRLLQTTISAEVLTITTWEAGSPCALPFADAILLERDGETLGYAAWDEVVEALPGALVPLELYPPRFLAPDFPEDWQLRSLELKPWAGGST